MNSRLPPVTHFSTRMKKGPVWHGTAIGWHSSLSSHIVRLPIISSRFCGVKLTHFNLEIVAYTAYLPTAGQDEDFIEEISLLTHDLLEHVSQSSVLIIGTDSNTSEKS